jgi:hypothetical protein
VRKVSIFYALSLIAKIIFIQEKQLTFEEVNQHFNNVDLTSFQKGGRNYFEPGATATGDILQKVRGIYKVVRPFLVRVSNLPLIPDKWKEAIKTFISLMDGLCP